MNRTIISNSIIDKRLRAATSLVELNLPDDKLLEYKTLCEKYPHLENIRQTFDGSTTDYAKVWYFLIFLSFRKGVVDDIVQYVPESWEHESSLYESGSFAAIE